MFKIEKKDIKRLFEIIGIMWGTFFEDNNLSDDFVNNLKIDIIKLRKEYLSEKEIKSFWKKYTGLKGVK